MSAPPLDHDAILRAVRQWPKDEQIASAREQLRANEHERDEQPPLTSKAKLRQESFQRLIGILATAQPAPSDEEIERWREERRMETYGRL